MTKACFRQKCHGFTQIELVVVVFALTVLALLILPAVVAAKHKSAKIHCTNNFMQIGMAFRIWESDHNDSYPMTYLATSNPTTTILADSSPVAVFQIMSNELYNPFILVCPADEHCKPALNFSNPLNSSNLSYFINIDAKEVNPQDLMSGDDNFEIGGSPIESGLWEITSNTPMAWSAARHRLCGNIALADGSVTRANNRTLKYWLESTNSVPVRLAIP